MKQRFTSWIQGMLLIISVIFILMVILILNTISGQSQTSMKFTIENVRNVLYLGSFIYFLIVVTVYFYLPVYYKRSFSQLKGVIYDMQQGIYDSEIALDELKRELDSSVYELLMEISEMKQRVKQFDQLKKEKIEEHYSRLQAIMRIIQEGVIILEQKGKIVMLNDIVQETFPQLEEDDNLLEKSYPAEIENNIKKLIQSSLQAKKRLEPIQCFIPNLKRHINIDSALVRNEAGEVTGIVAVLFNLEKKKTEKKQDKSGDTN